MEKRVCIGFLTCSTIIIGKLGVLAITGTIEISVLFRGIYRVIFERHLIPKIYASIAFFPRFQT